VATQAKAEDRLDMGFAIHAAVYVIVVGGLFYLNYTRNPDRMWVMWVAGGWGLGVALHDFLTYAPGFRERSIAAKRDRMEKRENRVEMRENRVEMRQERREERREERQANRNAARENIADRMSESGSDRPPTM